MQNQMWHLVRGTDLLPALSTGKEKILSYTILSFKQLPPGIHQEYEQGLEFALRPAYAFLLRSTEGGGQLFW